MALLGCLSPERVKRHVDSVDGRIEGAEISPGQARATGFVAGLRLHRGERRSLVDHAKAKAALRRSDARQSSCTRISDDGPDGTALALVSMPQSHQRKGCAGAHAAT